MTHYAIFSDIHGQLDLLRTVLADARQRDATTFIDLGDVGTDPYQKRNHRQPKMVHRRCRKRRPA